MNVTFLVTELIMHAFKQIGWVIDLIMTNSQSHLPPLTSINAKFEKTTLNVIKLQ